MSIETIIWNRNGSTITLIVKPLTIRVEQPGKRSLECYLTTDKAKMRAIGIRADAAGALYGDGKAMPLSAESLKQLQDAHERVKALDEKENGEIYQQQAEIIALEADVDKAHDAARNWQDNDSEHDAATGQQTERQAIAALEEAKRKYPEAWGRLKALRSDK